MNGKEGARSAEGVRVRGRVQAERSVRLMLEAGRSLAVQSSKKASVNRVIEE